jgi:hypothetical protein
MFAWNDVKAAEQFHEIQYWGFWLKFLGFVKMGSVMNT